MAKLRSRTRQDGAVDRFVSYKADKLLTKLFLVVFLGAGVATGYVAYHWAKSGAYWWIPAAWDAVALTGGVWLLARAKRFKSSGRRLPPGFIGPVGWLVAMVAAFGVGFLVGVQAR